MRCSVLVFMRYSVIITYTLATSWENLLMPYANNKGADQPARPRTRRLIIAFVVRCLVSIIPLVSITEISSHYLASVAAQAGLSLPWSQTPKTGFLVARLKFISLWGIALVCSGRATLIGERGGSVVECRTPEREVRGSRPTAAVLCPWARHFTPRKYWLITQEAMAPSRYDWKIVDWDVKPQHNQPTKATLITRERTNKPRLYRRYEPRHEKTCLRGFRSGKTQSGLRSQRS